MQRKKGVSLIVLVITIIVMIILAGAIVLTLNNSGIINKASEAVDTTNEAQVKQIAQVGWAAAYVEGARTEEELREGVISALEKNNINEEDYLINVTTSGVFVKLLKNAWIKDGFTVVKGDQVLEIGDVVNYDAGVSGYTAGWKVLGADDEGNLLIMSAGDIKTKFRMGYEDSMTTAEERQAESIKDIETGVEQLNTECEIFGHGKGVVGTARSITIEDVNSVTGYDPETSQYGKGQLYQYGNVVTYKYNETTKPSYESVVKNGILSTAHDNVFYYFNGEKVVNVNDLTSGTSGNIFATLTSDYYNYYASQLTTINKETNAKLYSMIFGNDDTYYWLASTCVSTETDRARFGVRYVGYGCVGYIALFFSNGGSSYLNYGIRAVVTLSSDITFTGSSESGWSY